MRDIDIDVYIYICDFTITHSVRRDWHRRRLCDSIKTDSGSPPGGSLSRGVLEAGVYIYIYIYRERERDRKIGVFARPKKCFAGMRKPRLRDP